MLLILSLLPSWSGVQKYGADRREPSVVPSAFALPRFAIWPICWFKVCGGSAFPGIVPGANMSGCIVAFGCEDVAPGGLLCSLPPGQVAILQGRKLHDWSRLAFPP